jgi:hypothetical protein
LSADIVDRTGQKQLSKAHVVFEMANSAVPVDAETSTLAEFIISQYVLNDKNIDATVESIAIFYITANQAIFYPLISTLFRILGIECRTGRRGVNYERSDAMIIDSKGCIPIEIKSPGEELEISVKGVRQALENKVILMARPRDGINAVRETTSLVVGYNSPNERSDVHELIEDIFETFDVRVGVVDFRSLLRMAIPAAIAEKRVSLSHFRTMKGVIHVAGVSPEQ